MCDLLQAFEVVDCLLIESLCFDVVCYGGGEVVCYCHYHIYGCYVWVGEVFVFEENRA